MKNLKERIFSNWSLMRVIRLGLATIVISEAWKNSEILFAILGGILMAQAVLNVGCCGTAGCDINHKPKKLRSADISTEETTFTEIK